MTPEGLAQALLLAGLRAALERRSIYVEAIGDGFRFSRALPARGQSVALQVTADGRISGCRGWQASGHVRDLLSSDR